MFLEGEVKWFSNDRGFGFIHPILEGDVVDEDTEYFVHFSSINMDGFKTLTAKQRVKFELRDTDKGMQAAEVSLL
jgi:cold shock protein